MSKTEPLPVRVVLVTGRDAEAVRDEVMRVYGGGHAIYAFCPEAGNHPADAADHFEGLLRSALPGETVVVATFCAEIFERAGAMIERGDLSSDAVEVVLCERGRILRARYDAKGCLQRPWPFGYFLTPAHEVEDLG